MIDFNVGIKAVIERDDNRILMLHKASKDLWETAGGRIDGNESVEETMHRELTEELPGIANIRIGELLHAGRVPGMALGKKALLLVWYKVDADFPDGVQISPEHDEFSWLTKEEAKAIASFGVAEAIDKL